MCDILHLEFLIYYLFAVLLTVFKFVVIFGKILSSCILLEFIIKFSTLLIKITKGTSFLEISKPQFSQYESLSMNLAYIINASAYLLLYNLFYLFVRIKTRNQLTTSYNLNFFFRNIKARISLGLVGLITGLPIKVLQILKLWYAQDRRHGNVLQPFSEYLARLLERKVIIYINGQFQINGGVTSSKKQVKNTVELLYQAAYSKFKDVDGDVALDFETKQSIKKQIKTSLCFGPEIGSQNDTQDLNDHIKNLNMVDSKIISVYSMGAYRDVFKQSKKVLREASFITHKHFKQYSFEGVLLGKGSPLRLEALNAIQKHPLVVDEFTIGKSSNPVFIAMTHRYPFGTIRNNSKVDFDDLFQTRKLAPIVPGLRAESASTTASFVAPVYNIYNPSICNINIPAAFDGSYEELLSIYNANRMQIEKLVEGGLVYDRSYPYINIFKTALEHNFKMDFIAMHNPELGFEDNTLNFINPVIQEIYVESIYKLKKELAEIMDHDTITAGLAALVTSNMDLNMNSGDAHAQNDLDSSENS